MPDEDFWKDAPIISQYSRAQAIDDGILIDLNALDNASCKEAGFKFPIAMTSAAFEKCIAMNPAAERAGNDVAGRLWDVLFMLRQTIRAARDGSILLFRFYCVVPGKTIRPQLVTLKCICGPGDTAAPVLTIMLPEED